MHVDPAEAPPIAFHVNTSLAGKRVIATDVARLRTAARVVLERGAAVGQLAFRLSDTHLHGLLLCSRSDAGEFLRRVTAALHWRLGLEAPFLPAEYTPVRTQSHLVRAFWYILRQEWHHGTDFDPLHEGSSLPDTLGWRAVDVSLPARVAGTLPRVRRTELLELLGPLAPSLAGDSAPELALACLSDAAGAAFAIAELAAGQSAAHVRARRVAMQVAMQQAAAQQAAAQQAAAQQAPARQAVSTRALAQALGLSQRRCQAFLASRSQASPCDAAAQRAVLAQWRLRSCAHAAEVAA